MLSREPISLTICCYTKEERGLMTNQFWQILYRCIVRMNVTRSGLGLGEVKISVYREMQCGIYTVAHIWKTAFQPVLMYGVQAVHLNRSHLLSMDSAQASLVKTTLGLNKSSRSTPLLQALKINKPSLLYYINSLELLEAHMKSGGNGRKLYSFLLTAK